MKPTVFLPLISLGIVIKLLVLWAFGKRFETQIESFLNAIERYQWWVVGALFALSFFQSARKGRPKSD